MQDHNCRLRTAIVGLASPFQLFGHQTREGFAAYGCGESWVGHSLPCILQPFASVHSQANDSWCQLSDNDVCSSLVIFAWCYQTSCLLGNLEQGMSTDLAGWAPKNNVQFDCPSCCPCLRLPAYHGIVKRFTRHCSCERKSGQVFSCYSGKSAKRP